jgi:hypothetical protein
MYILLIPIKILSRILNLEEIIKLKRYKEYPINALI